MSLTEWLAWEVLDNAILAWLAALGVLLGAWSGLSLARRLLRRRLERLAERRKVTALRVAERTVARTGSWFLFLVALFLGTRLLDLPAQAQSVIEPAMSLGLLLQLGLWATAAVSCALALRRARQLDEGRQTIAALDVLDFIARFGIWTILLLVMLDNLNVEVTALIAGLGIGGVAVALATQNILGDLFASLSIVLDKPFVVGDFLAVGDHLGSVEKVGIKTTRLRSLSGEQLVFSNNDLLTSRIRNFGRMYQRRVVFSFAVAYGTPTEKLARASAIVREAIEGRDRVRFDRAHFQRYGEYGLVFEAVYYVLSADYNLYVGIEQDVNLLIHRRFGEEGIEFAQANRVVLAPAADASGTERTAN